MADSVTHTTPEDDALFCVGGVTLDAQTLIDTVPGAVFCCLYDEALTLLYTSDSFLEMTGYSREELRTNFNMSLQRMIYQPDVDACLAEVSRQLAHSRSDVKRIEYRITCRDGSLLWVMDKGRLMHTADGRAFFCCILTDITELRETTRMLEVSLERHRIIMEHTDEIIFEFNRRTRELTVSPNWEKAFGPPPKKIRVFDRETLERTFHMHPDDAERFECLVHTGAGERDFQIEVRFLVQGERYAWYLARAALQHGEGTDERYIGLLRNIDLEKQQEQKLRRRAERDGLTGLYHRSAARALIEERLMRSPDGIHAVLMIDLDDFKRINDLNGHLFGDAVLAEFSSALLKCFRVGDIVSRLGGDEFMVFLENVGSSSKAMDCAKTAIEAAARLFAGPRAISCSVGVAMFPADGRLFSHLYRCADSALYHAKELGKNQAAMYLDSGAPFAREAEAFSGEAAPAAHTREEAADEAPGTASAGTLFALQVFDLLHRSENCEESIRLTLEIIGRKYDVSRTYIFEISQDGKTFSNTFEWCKEGIGSEQAQLQLMPYDGYDHYFGNFGEDGLFYCRDLSRLPETQQAVFASQGIQSVLQCTLTNAGRVYGFIGLDECQTQRYWNKEQVETLHRCADVVSEFLYKHRLETHQAPFTVGK